METLPIYNTVPNHGGGGDRALLTKIWILAEVNHSIIIIATVTLVTGPMRQRIKKLFGRSGREIQRRSVRSSQNELKRNQRNQRNHQSQRPISLHISQSPAAVGMPQAKSDQGQQQTASDQQRLRQIQARVGTGKQFYPNAGQGSQHAQPDKQLEDDIQRGLHADAPRLWHLDLFAVRQILADLKGFNAVAQDSANFLMAGGVPVHVVFWHIIKLDIKRMDWIEIRYPQFLH